MTMPRLCWIRTCLTRASSSSRTSVFCDRHWAQTPGWIRAAIADAWGRDLRTLRGQLGRAGRAITAIEKKAKAAS